MAPTQTKGRMLNILSQRERVVSPTQKLRTTDQHLEWEVSLCREILQYYRVSRLHNKLRETNQLSTSVAVEILHPSHNSCHLVDFDYVQVGVHWSARLNDEFHSPACLLLVLFLLSRLETFLLVLWSSFLALCLLQTVGEKKVFISVRFPISAVRVKVLRTRVMSDNFVGLILIELKSHSIHCLGVDCETVQPNIHGKGRKDHVSVSRLRRPSSHSQLCPSGWSDRAPQKSKWTPARNWLCSKTSSWHRHQRGSWCLDWKQQAPQIWTLVGWEPIFRACTRLPKDSRKGVIFLTCLFRLTQIWFSCYILNLRIRNCLGRRPLLRLCGNSIFRFGDHQLLKCLDCSFLSSFRFCEVCSDTLPLLQWSKRSCFVYWLDEKKGRVNGSDWRHQQKRLWSALTCSKKSCSWLRDSGVQANDCSTSEILDPSSWMKAVMWCGRTRVPCSSRQFWPQVPHWPLRWERSESCSCCVWQCSGERRQGSWFPLNDRDATLQRVHHVHQLGLGFDVVRPLLPGTAFTVANSTSDAAITIYQGRTLDLDNKVVHSCFGEKKGCALSVSCWWLLSCVFCRHRSECALRAATSAAASFDTLAWKSCNKLTTGVTGLTCQINGNSEESLVGGLCEWENLGLEHQAKRCIMSKRTLALRNSRPSWAVQIRRCESQHVRQGCEPCLVCAEKKGLCVIPVAALPSISLLNAFKEFSVTLVDEACKELHSILRQSLLLHRRDSWSAWSSESWRTRWCRNSCLRHVKEVWTDSCSILFLPWEFLESLSPVLRSCSLCSRTHFAPQWKHSMIGLKMFLSLQF